MKFSAKGRAMHDENAIESANYYPDSRKRSHHLECYHEKGVSITAGRLRSLDYGFFSSRIALFSLILYSLISGAVPNFYHAGSSGIFRSILYKS